MRWLFVVIVGMTQDVLRKSCTAEGLIASIFGNWMEVSIFFILTHLTQINLVRLLSIKKEMKTFPFPSILVGMTRFELATSGPPDRCATGLRHIPLSLPYSFSM